MEGFSSSVGIVNLGELLLLIQAFKNSLQFYLCMYSGLFIRKDSLSIERGVLNAQVDKNFGKQRRTQLG